MGDFHIRHAEWPRDRAAALAFIHGLQAFEFTVEKNRRLDDAVAGDHFAKLERDFVEKPHAVLFAEAADGTALGWAVVLEQHQEIYVVEQDRRTAYVAELYLVEAARGIGAGRALLAACEDWARTRGIAVMHIGVLPGNTRARGVYERAGFAPYAVELRKYL